jgi:hypothetical protein
MSIAQQAALPETCLHEPLVQLHLGPGGVFFVAVAGGLATTPPLTQGFKELGVMH